MSSSESESASSAFAASSAAFATSTGTRPCFGLSRVTQDNSSSKPRSKLNVNTCYFAEAPSIRKNYLLLHHVPNE